MQCIIMEKHSHFSGFITIKLNIKWILCVHSSTYSFMAIRLKLYRWLGHGLEVCMCFGYNPQTIFDTFSQVELNHFQALITIKVN